MTTDHIGLIRLGDRLLWRTVTLTLDLPGWPGHLASQHVDAKLTAEDGYSTQRSYSIVSAPNGRGIDLTV
jgi:hypothetical protein